MAIIALYENSVLSSQNKVGELKDMGNNYKELCLGAFDCLSLKGEYYDFNRDIKAMFESGSRLMQLVDSGRLRGEIEHPRPLPGQSMASFVNRVRMIDNSAVSHHIRRLRLQQGKDHQGKTIMMVIAEVTGSGPHMDAFNARLANRDENVDMSIRCFTHPITYKDGVPHKALKLPITWDAVNMGGIEVSNKYDTPSLESEAEIWTGDQFEISEEAILKSENENRIITSNMGMESDELIPSTLIKTALGWEKVELVSRSNAMFW